MKKLELKHLAPYLPYGLRANSNHAGKLIDNGEILGIDLVKGIHIANKNTDYFTSIMFIKPILRPLSDLTKEIEVNGEKFIPLIKLVDPDNKENNWSKITVESYNPFPSGIPRIYYRVIHSEIGEMISVNHKNINSISFNLVQKLLEWHFDIFNLIDQDLVIDINKI